MYMSIYMTYDYEMSVTTASWYVGYQGNSFIFTPKLSLKTNIWRTLLETYKVKLPLEISKTRFVDK